MKSDSEINILKAPNESPENPTSPIHQLKIQSIPEEYKIAIDRQEKESDRFWARSNIMLLVQGALISFYIGLKGKDNIFGTFTALEGMFLAIIWLAVLVKGKSYVSRWDHVIKAIEDSNNNQAQIQYPLNRIYGQAKDSEHINLKWLWGKSSTKLMQYAVVSILIFWIAALSLSLTIGLDEVKNTVGVSTFTGGEIAPPVNSAPADTPENQGDLESTKKHKVIENGKTKTSSKAKQQNSSH